MTISWEIPIHTVSESNRSEHWSIAQKRHKKQQLSIRLSFWQNMTLLKLPCVVILTRLAPRTLDDDNLVAALKWIRDELSEIMLPDIPPQYMCCHGRIIKQKGRCDSDPRIRWQYSQQKNKSYAVRIQITPM